MPSTTSSASTRSPRANSRAAAAARTEILQQLKDDHKSVKKAYREFKKLDHSQDHEAMQAIVEQVLDELTVHAALEEEFLYPAARAALSEDDLIDEAEVEHESVHTFINQLREMSPGDDKYSARFTVLCEYVQHHVKEEEGEMFPKLEKARMDWESLAAEMTERRAGLTPEDEDADPVGDGDDEGAEDGASAPARTTASKTASKSASKSASKTAGKSASKTGNGQHGQAARARKPAAAARSQAE